jgi:hypothetical protein
MSKAFLALIIVMVVPAQPISSALHADVRVLIAGMQLPSFAGDNYVPLLDNRRVPFTR